MKKRGLLWGTVVGFTNGFFASGGGIVSVMILKKFFSLKETAAHATSIMIILPLTLCGMFVYSAAGYSDFSVIIKAASVAALGAALGAVLLSRLPSKYIRILFGAVMIVASFRMFFGG